MVTAHNIQPILDLQIEAEVQEIRALEDQIEILEGFRATRRARLRTMLEERGDNWSDGNGGFARIVAESTRTAYNAKALDDLQLQSPWWHKRLNKYRGTVAVKGYVQVK